MAISNELSSEIATAILATKERSPRELNDLKDLVFEVHAILRQMTANERSTREHSQSALKKTANS